MRGKITEIEEREICELLGNNGYEITQFVDISRISALKYEDIIIDLGEGTIDEILYFRPKKRINDPILSKYFISIGLENHSDILMFKKFSVKRYNTLTIKSDLRFVVSEGKEARYRGRYKVEYYISASFNGHYFDLNPIKDQLEISNSAVESTVFKNLEETKTKLLSLIQKTNRIKEIIDKESIIKNHLKEINETREIIEKFKKSDKALDHLIEALHQFDANH